jgi:hypothetical protein
MSTVQSTVATNQIECLFSAADLSGEIRDLLNTFDGEDSLKRLFWELLSYDRVRDPLPLTFLPRSAAEFVATLEVFADSEAYTIVLASVRYVPLGGLLEQMAWALKRNIPNCILVLEHASTWSVVYPDEVLKPRVRILPLPGTLDRRDETAHALAALNAADEDSGEELTALELAQNLDEQFPGAMPNIGDLLTDFKRIGERRRGNPGANWARLRLNTRTDSTDRGEGPYQTSVLSPGHGVRTVCGRGELAFDPLLVLPMSLR